MHYPHLEHTSMQFRFHSCGCTASGADFRFIHRRFQKDDDDDWMERCRSGWSNDDYDRARFCEIARWHGSSGRLSRWTRGGMWRLHSRLGPRQHPYPRKGANPGRKRSRREGDASRIKVETAGEGFALTALKATVEVMVRELRDFRSTATDLKLETHNGPFPCAKWQEQWTSMTTTARCR